MALQHLPTIILIITDKLLARLGQLQVPDIITKVIINVTMLLESTVLQLIPDIIVKYSEVLLSAAPQHVPEIILKCTGPLLVPNIIVKQTEFLRSLVLQSVPDNFLPDVKLGVSADPQQILDLVVKVSGPP